MNHQSLPVAHSYSTATYGSHSPAPSCPHLHFEAIYAVLPGGDETYPREVCSSLLRLRRRSMLQPLTPVPSGDKTKDGADETQKRTPKDHPVQYQ